tara:strand:+ start:1332 stop:1571 length:240 start_codon:yes stop_codon:yes gene_type:complete
MLFGLLILGTVKYGDYITDDCPQGNYACPKICDIDHIHLPKGDCKDGKDKQKSNADTTTVSFSRQRYKASMDENKSKGL